MKYTFLALLNRQPAHGYEIKSAFDGLFGFVRSLNIGQIYSTLARMERDQLVTSREIVQVDRPNKRVYEITKAGQDALRQWLAKPTDNSRLKDEFVTKLILAEHANLGGQLQMIHQQRINVMEKLRQLQQIALHSTETELHTCMLEGAILHLEADLKWLDVCEQYFRNI